MAACLYNTEPGVGVHILLLKPNVNCIAFAAWPCVVHRRCIT